MSRKPIAVVDGANVAFIERSKKGDPKVENIVAVRQALQEKGFDVIVIADAALRHKVDDPDHLEALFNDQVVRQAPAGTDADYFVLATADEHEALVVSNDTFEPYRKQYPWLSERRVPLMIVRGVVELYKEPETVAERP